MHCSPTPGAAAGCHRCAAGGWELERKLEIAADALRLPPWEATIGKLSGGEKRRVALCRLLLSQPGHAAARRADQPPRRRIGRVARALPRGVSGHGRSRSPTTATSSTTSPSWILELDRGCGIPWQGNYSSWLEQKEQRLAPRSASSEALPARRWQRELEWVRQNPKARQAKSKARAAALTRNSRSQRVPEAQRDQRDLHPAGRAARRAGRSRSNGPAQGLRRPAADRQPVVQPAARRHRRHHRPQRRRQDHAVPHAYRRGKPRRRRDPRRSDGEARLRRPVAPDAR